MPPVAPLCGSLIRTERRIPVSVRRSRAVVTVMAVAATASVAFASTASAAPAQLTLLCQAQAPVIGAQNTTIPQSVEVVAPETVASGGAFDIVIKPGPVTVPTSVNGVTVKSVKNLALKVLIPDNVTFTGADLSGGDVGTPTITVAGNVATLKAAGPFAAGQPFALPQVTAHVVAGAPGTVETHLGGTSYADPALTLTTTANVLVDVDAPTSCYPEKDPILSTTTIV